MLGCRAEVAKLSFLDSNSLIAAFSLLRKCYFALNATNGIWNEALDRKVQRD